MDAAASRTFLDRHLQRRDTQLGVDAFGDRPTDDFAGVEIENRCQIHEAGTDPDVSDVRHPDFVHRSNLSVFDQVRMNRQTVTGIGGTDKRAPGDRPQIVLFHDASYALGIHQDATPSQLPRETAISVTGKLPMNEFNLTAKLFIFVVAVFLMLFVRFVVIAAGRQSAYFACFRN